MKNFIYSIHKTCSSPIAACFLALIFTTSIATKSAAQACPLICNDLITVEVPPNGSHELLPSEILEGTLLCPGGILSTQAQFGTNWEPASGNIIFDDSHVGLTLTCRVMDQVSGNTCWGQVQIEAAPPLLDTIHFKLCAQLWKDKRPIKGATLIFQPINQSFPYSPMLINLGPNQNCADMTIDPNDYLPGTTFSYGAALPDTGHTNGVNIIDLCAISQHILGINSLGSPYALIAGDVNKSASVTTFDIVESKKLILGVYDQLPNNESWQAVPDYCQFPNPNNPFGSTCQDGINLSDLIALNGDTARVLGIKIGDVNGDAHLNGTPDVSPTPVDSFTILLPQGAVVEDGLLSVPIKLDKNFSYGSLQINLNINPALAEYVSTSSGAVLQGGINTFYNAQTGNLRILILQNLSTGVNQVPAGDAHFFLNLHILKNSQLEDIMMVNTSDSNMKTFGIGVNCGGYLAVNSTYSGSVPTYSPERAGLRIQAPSPNPFSDNTTLGISLESAETATLELSDLTGRILFSAQRDLLAGTSQWEIPASAMSPGSLSIWRLRIGEQAVSGKLARK